MYVVAVAAIATAIICITSTATTTTTTTTSKGFRHHHCSSPQHSSHCRSRGGHTLFPLRHTRSNKPQHDRHRRRHHYHHHHHHHQQQHPPATTITAGGRLQKFVAPSGAAYLRGRDGRCKCRSLLQFVNVIQLKSLSVQVLICCSEWTQMLQFCM